MELKHLTQRFVYRIEPKPGGGFIARASDPTVPPLEAPTREELQQKIQARLVAALGEAFPGLKLPVENKQLKFEVHVERKPGGGFSVHSEQPGAPGINPATEQKIDHFAEELLGFVNNNFPHLSEAISARVDSEGLKLLASQQTAGALNASAQFGNAQAFPQAQPMPSSDVRVQDAATTIENATLNNAVIANTPITPESSGSGKIFRFLLTLAMLAALMYFFLYRR
ncbi:MAG: hypothetical protein WA628_23960 [Terriglobales bacterium]